MCSCHAPLHFLSNLESYNLPNIPNEIIDFIVLKTVSYSTCPYCEKVVAKSINSYCKQHCQKFIVCVDCKKQKKNCDKRRISLS